jgi:hypothetical protein
MISENALRDALLAVTKQCRMNYVMISALVAELASLRKTVSGLDPTFGDVMEQKRLESAKINAPLEREVLVVYDDILRRLDNGEVC